MRFLFYLILLAGYAAGAAENIDSQMTDQTKSLKLPTPKVLHVSHRSEVIGWEGERPQAPAGFEVIRFHDDLKHPRNTYQLPNGHILVAESDDRSRSANRITLLVDENMDGKVDRHSIFLKKVRQPFGIAYYNGYLYVGAADAVWKYPFKPGDEKISADGKKIISLPTGGYNHHWTRNLLLDPKKEKLYIAVGSASNVGEYGMDEEIRRANILQMNLDGSGEIVFASGMRNPVGMDFSETGELWTAVNERDNLGDRLVPDYLTRVQKGDFYGWPFSYFGQHVDPRRKGERPDLVAQAKVPDVALGSHTASLGLAFYAQTQFPKKYRWGAFVGQHGSWNRSDLVGYQVVFVPFKNGRPNGKPEPFLTGFIADRKKSEVHGRPVGVTVLSNGSLLVADDVGGTLWLVRWINREAKSLSDRN